MTSDDSAAASALALDARMRRVRQVLRSRAVAVPGADRLGEELWQRSVRRAGRSLLPASIRVYPGEVTLALTTASAAHLAGSQVVSGQWELSSVRIGPDGPLTTWRGTIDPDGPPSIAIGSQGTLYALTGCNCLRDVPASGMLVDVKIRHRDWAGFARAVRGYIRARGGSSYQPFLHPDLRDIPSTHGHQRFDLIRQHLPVTSGRVLDIGANTGYFCHRFEEVGFQCVAVERSVKESYILRKHRDAMHRTFAVAHGAIEEMDPGWHYDAVLALNIFHHFLKKRTSFNALAGYLRRLRTDWMILEPHRCGEEQLSNAEVALSPEELTAFVSTESGLPSVQVLGEDGGRPIYLLGRR